MAKLDFIFQAVTTANHGESIRQLLELSDPTQILVSVAFVRQAGLDELETAIKSHAEKTRFFIGIRNGITSVQAVKRLLGMKADVYAVDTGSRNTLFHPKLYFALNATHAIVIIGSANLTIGGLHNNIEASTCVKLDLSDALDKKFTDEITSTFDEMLKSYPRHVFLIRDDKHADEINVSGRLADENMIPAPSTFGRIKKGERDNLPTMKLSRLIRPRIKETASKVAAPSKTINAASAPPVEHLKATNYLVWESKPLTERDLNIPTASSTHATGSMGLKKGALDHIDQRHYFRDEVFVNLTWIADSPPKKWERALAKFELVIKNLNYGVLDLQLSHFTDQKSASYKQNNFMTQLHWGIAKKHVAKKDLLGRILYLYRKDTVPPEFMIEID
jgi:HKD family nuclease